MTDTDCAHEFSYWSGDVRICQACESALEHRSAPAQSPLTDAMLDAHLKATDQWVDPYEAATDCGVPIECGITQEDADELNAQSRESLRVGYAAAFSSTNACHKTTSGDSND